jgi:hypothetical protein
LQWAARWSFHPETLAAGFLGLAALAGPHSVDQRPGQPPSGAQSRHYRIGVASR